MALTKKEKEYQRKYREKHLEEVRKRKRDWARKERKLNTEKVRAYDRFKHQKYKAREQQYARTYKRKVDPLKLEARTLLNAAVRLGKLKKPKTCERCSEKEVQAHHPDYNKPYEVIWLCVKHHMLEHYPIKPLDEVINFIKQEK